MATNRLIVKEQIQTYAAVLFQAVTDGDDEKRALEVHDEFEQIMHLLLSDMELSRALSDPAYTAEQRATIARGVFASCDPALVEVLAVMASRGDLKLVPRVFSTYGELIGDKLNIAIVDVTTAVALDDPLRKTITAKAEADLGKKVVLRESIDKSILGGIIMSTRGRRIDASMVTQLNHARTVLKERTNGGESS